MFKNYGDITKIDGRNVEFVDCIIGGSPCTSFSQAGKRTGFEGESGLFLHQIRIVNEMRIKSEGKYPRYMVLENVLGILTCNNGKDFQRVLMECINVAVRTSNNNKSNQQQYNKNKELLVPDVPLPKGGKWPKSGLLYDEMGRWSIAWRVHDAQYWGFAQRRRRIALVVDFGGLTAPEVLFESQSMSGDFNTCNSQGERVTKNAIRSIKESDKQFGIWDARGNGDGQLANTITGDHDNRITDYSHCVVEQQNKICVLNFQGNKSGCGTLEDDTCFTLNTMHGSDVYCIVQQQQQDLHPCLCIGKGKEHVTENYTGDYDNRITDYTNVVQKEQPFCSNLSYAINSDIHESGLSIMMEVSHALKTTTKESVFVRDECTGKSLSENPSLPKLVDKTEQTYPCLCIGNGQECDTQRYTEDVSQTLNCMHDPMTILEPCAYQLVGVNSNSIKSSNPHEVSVPVRYRIRRLTPLECTRLQGFPDGWVDIGDWFDSKGKKHKESNAPKYRALGNSIALPFWKWLCKNIVNQIRKSGNKFPTMASLFAGIGGFDICWSEAKGAPMACAMIYWGEDFKRFKKYFSFYGSIVK